jgi:hypothetical protein
VSDGYNKAIAYVRTPPYGDADVTRRTSAFVILIITEGMCIRLRC